MGKISIVSKIIIIQVSHSVLQDAKSVQRSAAQDGLVQLGSYLCCNWLSLYMQLDGLAQVRREIRSAGPRKDNINMQRILCVMECRISVQMGKFPCVGAHNRSESTSSLAT